MLTVVNSFLGFDGGCIPNRECLVVGQNEENGAFLLHQVVSAAVKEQRCVCLVSFVQKFHHYNAVSLKVGVSLQSAVDAKQFQFIDGLEELTQTFFPDACDPSVSAKSPDIFFEVFRIKLVESLRSLKENTQTEPVLVLDDISVLLSMGYHVDIIKMFVKSLLDLLWFSSSSSPQVQNGTSVAVLTSYNEHDKDSMSLWNFLICLSSVDVDVTGLQTGYCKDVHGQVCVMWRDSIDAPRRHSTKILQFKLIENGVDFFAPGTSSAVL